MTNKTKTTKQTNELSVIGTGMDIPNILKQLDVALKATEVIETTKWKTNGNLPDFGDIKLETKPEVLVAALASVIAREKAYSEAAALLNVTVPVFSLNGTKEDWMHDIKLRLAIINQDAKVKQLKEFKAEASKFVSEQQQQEMLIQKMADYFKNNS